MVEPTPLKNMLVKMGSSSPGKDENKKYLKPPPSYIFRVCKWGRYLFTSTKNMDVLKKHLKKQLSPTIFLEIFRSEWISSWSKVEVCWIKLLNMFLYRIWVHNSTISPTPTFLEKGWFEEITLLNHLFVVTSNGVIKFAKTISLSLLWNTEWKRFVLVYMMFQHA